MLTLEIFSLSLNIVLIIVTTGFYLHCRQQASKILNLLAANRRARNVMKTLYNSGSKLNSQL